MTKTSLSILGEHRVQLSWVSCSDPSPPQWGMTLFSSFVVTRWTYSTPQQNTLHKHRAHTCKSRVGNNPEHIGVFDGMAKESKPGACFKNNIYLLQLVEQWGKLPFRILHLAKCFVISTNSPNNSRGQVVFVIPICRQGEGSGKKWREMLCFYFAKDKLEEELWLNWM